MYINIYILSYMATLLNEISSDPDRECYSKTVKYKFHSTKTHKTPRQCHVCIRINMCIYNKYIYI